MSSILQKRVRCLRPCLRLPPPANCISISRRSYSSFGRHSPKVFRVSSEVEEAVQSGRPVVALETTIYTHGFPYPHNVALASHLESVVRTHGGIPATIGVLHGVARVGLNPEEIIELASAAGKKETMKVSRRDLPYITGLGLAGKSINGGTTVAGTMILAKMAGVEVFGTGGLGGVHRGGENTMDISADLTELGRTPVSVVSSGCKSFLDIARTLEYLETQGVPVSTFADGRTGEIDLPAFWSRESGVRSPSVVHDEKEAASIIYAQRLLGIQSGLLFANPIPLEHSIPRSEMDHAIEEAIQDAQRQGIHGHANTPFILARIKQLTRGKSIPANRALIESNVSRATKVAIELSKLSSNTLKMGQSFMPAEFRNTGSTHSKNFLRRDNSYVSQDEPLFSSNYREPQVEKEADVLVAGSVAVDLSCDYEPLNPNSSLTPIPHTSNPAAILQSVGGVGHNVATAAHLIGNGLSVRLCSLVADDLAGKLILSSLEDRGLDVSAIRTLKIDPENPERTAQYVAINDASKDLAIAMADMRIISSPRTDFGHWESVIQSAKASWVIVDSNWDESVILQWVQSAKAAGAKVVFEPVSVAKSSKLFPLLQASSKETSSYRAEKWRSVSPSKGVYPMHQVDLSTPNEHELVAMHTTAKSHNYFEGQDWWTVIDAMGISPAGAGLQLQHLASRDLVDQGIPQRMIQLLPFIPTIITKLGAKGILIAKLLPINHPMLQSPRGAPYILSRNTNESPDVGGIYMRLFPAAETVSEKEVVSVNGVGDTFLGVVIAGLAKGLQLDEALINIAQKAAVMTLKSKEAVSPDLHSLAVELVRMSGDITS